MLKYKIPQIVTLTRFFVRILSDLLKGNEDK